jgi:hypothetical protein
VKEDEAKTHIPQEAAKAANKLLHDTPKVKEPKVGPEKDRRDHDLEWVVQWTSGTVQRLAQKLKIWVGRWDGYSATENNESHYLAYEPSRKYLGKRYDEFIVEDQDFRIFSVARDGTLKHKSSRWQHG